MSGQRMVRSYLEEHPARARHRDPITDTPGDGDFCPCGGSYVLTRRHRRRVCGWCGTFEPTTRRG